MDSLLHMRIDLHHLLIHFRMLAHHNLGIPRCGHEDSLDAARQRRGEAMSDLQSDQEGIGDNDWSESAVLVVAWVGEEEVEVCKQGASVGHESRAHRHDGANKAFVDKRIDTAVCNVLVDRPC